MSKFTIIGLGEILWDLLPSGKKLGGAPANFAYVANALGNHGMILSRVGKDTLGEEILEHLKAKDLATDHIQIDGKYPTGTVNVSLIGGQPSYQITEAVAWDFLELSDDWRKIAAESDAVCFGSLAQRSECSRQTIELFLNLTEKLRIFDVNLRQAFYSKSILDKSINLSNVVKINHEELPVIAEMFEIKEQDALTTARLLLEKCNLKLVCLTRGASGSLLVSKKEFSDHRGIKVEIADSIGAGDAFTAALAHGLLRGWHLDEINDFANRVGSFVASKSGAMPDFAEDFTQ